MQFRSMILTATLATFAAADFQIYTDASITGQLDGSQVSASGYFIFPGPPSCNDVCDHAIFIADVDDASKGRNGIRCKGPGCAGKGEIKQLEFHDVDTKTHWTIYKSGHYTMKSAKNGSDQGHCHVDHGDNFTDCSCGLGNSENGHRLFICKSSHTAKQMGVYK